MHGRLDFSPPLVAVWEAWPDADLMISEDPRRSRQERHGSAVRGTVAKDVGMNSYSELHFMSLAQWTRK